MENHFLSNHTFFIFRPNIMFSNMIISAVLGVISSYLLTALIVYKVKIRKQKRHWLSTTISPENKFVVLSKTACIIIGIASFIRQWSAFGRMFIENSAIRNNYPNGSYLGLNIEKVCDVFPALSNIALCSGNGLVFLFLWFRQRVFYVHPSMKSLNNKVVICVSSGIMGMWFLYYLFLSISYFFLVEYDFQKYGGCLAKESSYDSYTALTISYSVVSIVMQFLLLGLFIYPILKLTSWRKNHHRNRNSNLIQRVKKAVILTFICCFTDVATIITYRVFNAKNENGEFFDFNLNLMINHLVCIACFDQWKKILWPWNFNPRKDSLQT